MRFLIFLFAQIFLIHNFSWAFSETSPQLAVGLKFASTGLNSLTKSQRLDLIEQSMKNRPSDDATFISENMQDWSESELPKYTILENVVTITIGSKKFDVVFLDSQRIVYDGETFDFGPGKLRTTSMKFSKAFETNKVSLMDFLIPSAHAQVDFNNKLDNAATKMVLGSAAGVFGVLTAIAFLVEGPAVLAIGSVALAGFGVYLYAKGEVEKTLSIGCAEAQTHLQNENAFSSKEELRLALKYIQTSLDKLKRLQKCKEDKHKELCSVAEKCMKDSITSLSTTYNAVSTSARGNQKVTPATKDSVRAPAVKNSKQ